jgi:hypothetical protein
MSLFKKGDPVVALKTITRVDKHCFLRPGENAVIRDASPMEDGAQIVSITMPDGNVMIDIVVRELNPPLKHK